MFPALQVNGNSDSFGAVIISNTRSALVASVGSNSAFAGDFSGPVRVRSGFASGSLDVGGPVSISGGVTMTGGSSNLIDFGQNGVAPPSSASAGWKIKLWGNNYGLGIDGGSLWYVAANDPNGNSHRWFTTDGTTYSPQMRLDHNGHLVVRTSVIAPGTPDLAETIPTVPEVSVADVVCADPRKPERAIRCSSGARTILGVISDGTSSFLINSRGGRDDAPLTGKPLVLAGRVPVKVSLENGPIQIGDYLAPSSTPGVAMRLTKPGPSVGVALAPFEGSKGRSGTVLCFVKVGDQGIARVVEENDVLRQRVARLEQMVAEIRAARTTRPKRAVARLEKP